MIREAIILTSVPKVLLNETRLDFPQCLTPVEGHPFLYYVIRHLEMKGIERFIFSLGPGHEVVKAYLRNHFPTLVHVCIVEKETLLSGNAIANALEKAEEKNVLIQQGNIFFKIDLHALATFHAKVNAECTIALKPMKGSEQYSVVLLGEDGRIHSVEEGKFGEPGNINGGVYLLDKDRFLTSMPPGAFSFEKDYLALNSTQKEFYGVVQDCCFVDITIADIEKARHELKHFPFPFDILDRTWTLFLDRDGVININKDDGYIVHRDEFIFKEGALEAIQRVSGLFGRIIVITNQRGVGKGLMSEADLEDIHVYMKEKINFTGGRIDDIFYATSAEDVHPDRKPSTGMAIKAKEKYPEIEFSKSIMIGDKAGDMQWGRNIGALTVWIPSVRYKGTVDPADIDLRCGSLYEFAHLL